MSSADDNFFPAVFVARVGRERGFSEAQVVEALEKLRKTLTALEERLEGCEYLAGGFSLADVAHAGNFVRLRELAEEGGSQLSDYPNVRKLDGEDRSAGELQGRGLNVRRSAVQFPGDRSASASRTIAAVGWFFGPSGVE